MENKIFTPVPLEIPIFGVWPGNFSEGEVFLTLLSHDQQENLDNMA